MTTKITYSALAAGCIGLLINSLAFGQACTANKAAITAPTNLSGNTCNNNLTQVKICGNGDTLNQAGIDIFQFTVGAGNNFTATVTSSAFIPEISLTSTTTCTSNAPCTFDNAAPQATAPYSVSGSASALASGTYFLFISDLGADNPGCGAYNLAITGTLPVQLKSFSID